MTGLPPAKLSEHVHRQIDGPEAHAPPDWSFPIGGIIQLRWHGRGGQGVVTASRILATAALEQGLYPQSLPDFGAERSGAPLSVHTRLSDRPFWDHSHITRPDIVIVVDSTLLSRVPVLEGIAEGGILVVNTDASPAAVRQSLPGPYARVCVVNATGIATELLGRNLPNAPVLGALLQAIPMVQPERVAAALAQQFGPRISAKVLEANLQAFRRGYDEARVEGALCL